MSEDDYLEPPCAVDAERTILGAVLRDPDRLLEIAQILRPDDFFLDSHRRIMAAMIAVVDRDGSVDEVTLGYELSNRREIGAVGGHAYISDLTTGVPRRVVIENHIRIVRDKSLCRALIGVAERLKGRAYSQDESGLEIASQGIADLSEVADAGKPKSEIFSSADLVDDAEYRLVDHPEASNALPTGLESLDEFTGGGIRLGELWIIGASPSRGKTTLARQIVKHSVARGTPAYVQSGEMTKESWFDITACLLEDFPATKLREPQLLNLTQREQLRAALRRLSTLPLHISDSGGIHVDRLIWNATRKVKQDGVKLMAVDYAQIVRAPGKDDRQRVTQVADRLREFAKENNVACMLLSQSPRPEGRNINARPTMYSLKESGALEEAAHTVLLPYRPVDTDSGAFTGEDEIIIGKQRAGAIGTIPVFLNGKYLRFEERR